MYPNKQPNAAYRDSVGVEFDEALSADALDAALPRRRWRVLRMHRSPYALAASAYRYHVGLGAEKEAWLTRVPARESSFLGFTTRGRVARKNSVAPLDT